MSNDEEISLDLSPLIQIHKNGTVNRLVTYTIVPAGHDPQHDVVSKDVFFSTDPNLSARIYAPSAVVTAGGGKRKSLPILIYYHGGGFCIESAFSQSYHGYVNALVAAAKIVVVSVEYRLAPEHPLPCAYDDSWSALKWIASHAGGSGAEDWLNEFVDFGQIYLAGDSAGANIAHRVAMRNGEEKVIDLIGIVLVDPYFLGTDPIGDEPKYEELWRVAGGLWLMANPGSVAGLDDPEINVTVDPKLPGLGCRRVLILVAEKDMVKDRGWRYYETMGKNGWKGTAEIEETKGEGHVFHLHTPTSESAAARMKRTVLFLNQGRN
ncbi:Probable carboxylesterase 13 [Linum perenne]